jgi:hypothetical protein
MSDNYPVDSSDLRARGTKGVMSAIGGVGLLGVNALISIPVIGWVVGGGLVLLGISGLFGKSRTDKTTGGLMMAAGGAGLAALLLPSLTHALLGLGGVALLAFGGWNIFKFIKGLRSRA